MNELPRLRTALDMAPVGMAGLDLQGRVLWCNQALERILGYTAAELRGIRFLTAFTPPQDAALEAEYFLDLVDGKRPRYHLENRYIRKDRQTVWGRLNVALVPAEGVQRPFCLSIIEDVTERRRREEHLRHTVKMESLARMAGEVVVRLNHVMLASLGSSQLLLESLPEHEHARELVATLRDAVDRSAALTRQLIAFGARQMLYPTPINPNALLHGLLPRIRSVAGRNVELQTLLHPQVGQIQVDQAQLERALMILVQNAVDAMPDGGKLTLRTSHVEFGEAPGADSELPEGAQVVFSVSDTGFGLEPKALERLYEPFYSTKEQGRGSGLSLAAVYGIVKQNGGHIEAASEPGHVACFHLYFPLAPDTVVDFELPGSLADTKHPSETVLLVEEADSVRAQLRRVLRAEGYHVLETRHGGEALLLCLRHEGPIHLLVADAVMPHLSGRELAAQAAPLRPDMRVLLLTQHVPEVVPHGPEGNQDYLRKPITPEAFGHKVRELLAGIAAPIKAGR